MLAFLIKNPQLLIIESYRVSRPVETIYHVVLKILINLKQERKNKILIKSYHENLVIEYIFF